MAGGRCAASAMSRAGQDAEAAASRSIFFAEEMSASENQAVETSKDTDERKADPPRNKIRIRLIPRKRLSNGLLAPGKKVPEDTNNTRSKKVPEQTSKKTTSENLTTAAVQGEASSNCPRKGLCNEANSNTLKTLPAEFDSYTSSDKLPEEANENTLSKNLTITTAVQGNDASSYPAKKGLCEEANNNTPSKALPVPVKELPEEPIDNTPSKNLTTTGEQGEEEKNNSPRKRLLYDTTSNTPSQVVPEEAMHNPSRNLTTTAVKCEEVFEQAHNHIPTKKLSDKAKKNAPSNRPTDPIHKNTPRKKLCTSVVQTTDTSQNISGMKLSASVGQAMEQSFNAANLVAIKEYQEFEEKVKRTVYLDNFSHQATEAVIKTALDQFGTVRKVSFLVNYTIPYNIPQSALVEMETEKDAVSVVNMLHEFPFMMSGMPRPVRAQRATAEMFNDRPWRPGSKLEFHWMGPTDPDYEIFKKLKLMSRRHEVENLALIKHELEEEQLLAKQQQEILNCNYRKLEAMDSVILSGRVDHMSRIYSLNFDEVF